MEISLKVVGASWEIVYLIPKGTRLVKGRHGLYHEIVDAAGKISERFGCYSWGTPDKLFYIGSFSKDYKRGDHKSNLHGRIHNYLQNHREKDSGQKNTNLMVFDNLNQSLIVQDVMLSIYRFDHLELGVERIEYPNYTEKPEIVRALEQLLICLYKRDSQCIWNRE